MGLAYSSRDEVKVSYASWGLTIACPTSHGSLSCSTACANYFLTHVNADLAVRRLVLACFSAISFMCFPLGISFSISTALHPPEIEWLNSSDRTETGKRNR